MSKTINTEANARRISFVETCFGTSGQPLSLPGRVLIGEGILSKSCRKKLKSRQFFLFNDVLIYGNIVLSKKRYNKQRVIPLEEVQLVSISDLDALAPNGWVIKTQSKSFAVYAATAAEKQEWMAHIEKCVRDLVNKGEKKAVNEHAAVWVPDNEALVCMACKKTPFTFINRRHHCRKCGGVVCGPCSRKRWLFPSRGNKAMRVCDPCFDIMANSSFDGAGAGGRLEDAGQDGKSDSSGEDDSDDEMSGHGHGQEDGKGDKEGKSNESDESDDRPNPSAHMEAATDPDKPSFY